MSLISFDVEASGPSPVTADIVSVGFVVIDGKFDRTFFGEARPENSFFDQGAYDSIGLTRAEHESYAMSQVELAHSLNEWQSNIGSNGRHTLVSDNPAFDWQFVSGLFARAGLVNPFGWSARRIGDFALGLSGNFHGKQTWKRLRDTRHTHNPVDDAKGNAEALWKLMNGARNGR